MIDRLKVYSQIDKERDYQDSIPEHSVEQDKNWGVSDWIIFMEHKLNSSKQMIYEMSEPDALEQIIKVVALGVACLEYNFEEEN